MGRHTYSNGDALPNYLSSWIVTSSVIVISDTQMYYYIDMYQNDLNRAQSKPVVVGTGLALLLKQLISLHLNFYLSHKFLVYESVYLKF